jgi:glycosyltransferase involved in cell wall biosynthesis
MHVKTPAVSVLMPVYNGERFLTDAIDSILHQNFTDFEFVIIDDGSTDASPAILADYAYRDARIRVVRQANAGIVVALNRGLAECRAPLVARMDADDVSLPDRFAAQAEYLTNHPDVVAIGAAFQLMADSGALGPVIRHPVAPKDVACGLRTANRIAHPSVMMRRDPVLALGGYREALRYAEDYDLWARLSVAHKLANHPKCLLRYRVHAGQISWSKSDAQAMATLAVRGYLAERDSEGYRSGELPQKIDREVLRSLGFSDRDHEDALVACVAGRITDYEAVNMQAEAGAARAALLEFTERSGTQSMRSAVYARLAWADFVTAWRTRHWLTAIRSLSRCAAGVIMNRHLIEIAVRRFLRFHPAVSSQKSLPAR